MAPIDSTRIFKAMGHCWPMDSFSEHEVKEVASALEADPEAAWSIYERALEEAQDEAPPAPIMG